MWEVDAFGRIKFSFGQVADHLHVDGWSRMSQHHHHHHATTESSISGMSIPSKSFPNSQDLFWLMSSTDSKSIVFGLCVNHLAAGKLSKPDDMRESNVIPPGCMARLSESMLKDAIIDAEESRPRVGLVGDTILPTLANDSSGIRLLEPLQTFDIPMRDVSCPESLQKNGKDHGQEDHGFCSHDEAVIADDPV